MSITKAYLNELMDEPIKDINWFKDGVIPKMKGFEFRYRTNKNNGVHHIGFRSVKFSGHIDFWSSGMLEVFILDNETGDELIDRLLDADQEKEKRSTFRKLFKRILKVV
jgi:hypothetical protein